MKNRTGRYSSYIRPFSYALDLLLINVFSWAILPHLFDAYFIVFSSLSWVIIAINIGFYEVYRFTKTLTILNKIIKQFALFTILCYAFSGFYIKDNNSELIFKYALCCIVAAASVKLFIFYFLKKYRALFGGNLRNIVIVGNSKSVGQLASFFRENPDYGYHLVHIFDLQ